MLTTLSSDHYVQRAAAAAFCRPHNAVSNIRDAWCASSPSSRPSRRCSRPLVPEDKTRAGGRAEGRRRSDVVPTACLLAGRPTRLPASSQYHCGSGRAALNQSSWSDPAEQSLPSTAADLVGRGGGHLQTPTLLPRHAPGRQYQLIQSTARKFTPDNLPE